jgi:hypothetical protein
MPPTDVCVIRGEHVLRPPPRPVPLDDAGYADIANRKLFHTVSQPSRWFPRSVIGAARAISLNWERKGRQFCASSDMKHQSPLDPCRLPMAKLTWKTSITAKKAFQRQSSTTPLGQPRGFVAQHLPRSGFCRPSKKTCAGQNYLNDTSSTGKFQETSELVAAELNRQFSIGATFLLGRR